MNALENAASVLGHVVGSGIRERANLTVVERFAPSVRLRATYSGSAQGCVTEQIPEYDNFVGARNVEAPRHTDTAVWLKTEEELSQSGNVPAFRKKLNDKARIPARVPFTKASAVCDGDSRVRESAGWRCTH